MKRKRLSAKKRRAIRRAVAGLIAAAAVAFSGIITFGDELGLNTPNWEQIKASVGAQDQANLTALPVNVFYIDVGQGDCELIHTPSGNILIDAGESLPENAAKIISFAKQLEIEKFDCVIATHPHSDHIGSMADVLEKIPADQIIMPELPEEETQQVSMGSLAEKEILEDLRELNINDLTPLRALELLDELSRRAKTV